MRNFNYYNPTRILFGQGQIARIDKEIPATARVLITYGGGSAKKNGTIDEVRQALGERAVFEFSGIEPNPHYETLMKGVELARAEKIDFLLAVGGGSVMDGTKFMAAATLFEGDPWKIVESGGRAAKAALPLGTIVTLPATGSEMNCGGVVTKIATKDKLAFSNPVMYPRFSVLDPTKTYTLPQRQVANGVVDAFVHVVEQYLTYPVNSPVQDRFAEGLLLTLIEEGPKALATPLDYDVRANVMWAATQALSGLIATGVPQDWSTHMIGHELTVLFGLDHGQSLAVVLPATLSVCREAKAKRLVQYAERVWGIKGLPEDQAIEEAIQRTAAFFESLGVSTRLSGYKLGIKDIPAVIEQLERHGMIALGENKAITPEVSRRILELCA
ncbi:MAG: iron-containing alcohol dehydrogenase [Rhodospirillaceae bacterium]|nr:iron-containing alcohol dehydrogenase [Rhodospirillaceae bacterium]